MYCAVNINMDCSLQCACRFVAWKKAIMDLADILHTSVAASLETASYEQNTREKEFNDLKDHVQAYGYNILCNVPYDGNCFFTSVCLLIGKKESEASHLRHQLIEFLKSKVI